MVCFNCIALQLLTTQSKIFGAHFCDKGQYQAIMCMLCTLLHTNFMLQRINACTEFISISLYKPILSSKDCQRVVIFLKSCYSYDSFSIIIFLSPSVWVDQRSYQGDIIVINWLITIISPCPETFKTTVLTLIYSCVYTCKQLLWFSASNQGLQELMSVVNYSNTTLLAPADHQ